MLHLLVVASLLLLQSPEDLQKAGMQALDKGDYRSAVDLFSKAAAADPNDYASFFNLALAETQLREDDKAISHYQRTLALKPDLYEAELNLGIVLLRNGKASEAAEYLAKAAKQKPKEVRPKRYLADALLAKPDLPNAEIAYKEALQLEPRSAVVELGLGQSLQRQGKLDDALPHYRSAASLDPKLSSYFVELAGAFSQAHRSPEAIALLKDVPATPAVWEELGRLYLANNQPAAAVEAFQSAVTQSPTPANRLALATAYLRNNQAAMAAPLLEQALASSPTDFDLQMVVGRIRRDQHNYRAAAAQFVTAAGLRPDSVEAWNEAASAFVLSEQYPQALAALDKVHGLGQESAGNFYYRAIALDKLHQLKPAIASYRKFLELSNGKFPDQEFNARQRSKTLEHEVNR